MTPDSRPASRFGAAPLQAVDEVESCEDGGLLTVHATKAITASDPYMAGHYPGEPIYPGVFVVESLRQAVLTALADRGGPHLDLAVLRSLRLTAPLQPGETLRIEAAVAESDAFGSRTVTARCLRSDGLQAARISAEFTAGAAGD